MTRKAVEHAARHGIHFFDAELLRLEAERAYAEDPGQREALLRQAMAKASGQAARTLELRAARSLAEHWREAGRRNEAYALLAPLVDAFTEGADTRDLLEARALLDALA